MKKSKNLPVSFTAEYLQSSEGGMHFALVPAEIKSMFAERGIARIVAKVGDLEPFQCGLMPYRDGDGYIIINKARQKELGAKPGDEIPISISRDESEWGAPMPEELEALLTQDEEAKAAFDALTPGKKRAVMYGVAREKGVERRIDTAVRLLLDPRAGHARW